MSLLYAVVGGVARVTLNRPGKRNALSAEMIAELKRVLAASAEDVSVQVILLTGAGADFCSGADLSGLRDSFQAGVLDHLADARKLAELFLAMRHHPKPVVAAVRGRALAGGCGLATTCDVVLAEESAQFGYPEVNIGFVPAMVMAILRRSVSEKRAFDLIASGDIVSARAAYEMGLITRVVANENFDAEVDAYVSKLANKSASAVSLSKHLLYHMDAMGFEAALDAGIQVNGLARMTEDYRRGIDRFLAKGKESNSSG